MFYDAVVDGEVMLGEVPNVVCGHARVPVLDSDF